MGTQSTKWFVFTIVFSFQVTFSQSKGIRYQYANVSNVIQANSTGNNATTFEIGNGDVAVYTPYLTLPSQPNVGYSALSRFGPDLCYKGSELIPYPSNANGIFYNAISKNDGGFATNTQSKPYIIRNYNNRGQLLFEKEIVDKNTYGNISPAPEAPKMVAHPVTNNLFFAYLEYSDDIDSSNPNHLGSPIINFVEIANDTGAIINTFKLEIPYYRPNDFTPAKTVNTWVFDSEIIDIKYASGNVAYKDRIWITLKIKHEGSYIVDASNSITYNPALGLFANQTYTSVISVAPYDELNPDNANLIALLPASSAPKIIQSKPINGSGYAEMMLYSTENQKPVMYNFPFVGFMDTYFNNRYEFPFTLSNLGDIKYHQNTLLFSFDRHFGTFNENNLQINLRQRNNGFFVISNSGTISFPTRTTNSLYINYNTTTGSGAPTNFLIKESLSDFQNTCFSGNFSNTLATSQPALTNYESFIVGSMAPQTGIIFNPDDPSSIYANAVFNLNMNNMMTVYLQCNVGPCVPPQNRVGNVENENSILKLSPNPTNNYFEVIDDARVQQVAVYSMLGQLIKTYEKQEQYSVVDFAKGTYIVKITTADGQFNKTLIIE